MPIYEKLCAIVEEFKSLGYLAAYSNDLYVHDKNHLEKTAAQGVRYIWILRDHGTELFEIAAGRDPVWVTYWLQGNNRAFLCDVSADTVRPISWEKAAKLAAIPHPNGISRKV